MGIFLEFLWFSEYFSCFKIVYRFSGIILRTEKYLEKKTLSFPNGPSPKARPVSTWPSRRPAPARESPSGPRSPALQSPWQARLAPAAASLGVRALHAKPRDPRPYKTRPSPHRPSPCAPRRRPRTEPRHRRTCARPSRRRRLTSRFWPTPSISARGEPTTESPSIPSFNFTSQSSP
jgi:hypothetical protein